MSGRVNITDVAREAGVSAQTVSRALNNKGEIRVETRRRVFETAERLGYRPNGLARGLVMKKTSTLGLIVPDIANPFFAEVVRGAEDAAHHDGYSLLLCNTVEDPARELEAIHMLDAQRVDGVILCSSRLSDDVLVTVAERLPAVVLVNRQLSDRKLGSVCIDDEAGAFRATQYLFASGRRSIGFLSGPPTSYSGGRRMQGYRRALREAGLTEDPSLIAPCAPHIDGGFEAAKRVLAAGRQVDALLCYNDLVAVGALQACMGCGRTVPDDIAIVGCDDVLLAGLVTPPLATLRSDRLALGAEAVRLLLRTLGAHTLGAPTLGAHTLSGCTDGCENIVLQPELVVRASAPAAALAVPHQ